MRRSQLFIKTRRDAPADETSKNAQLLIRAGFINKEMAGVYSYLPLGKIVLENIIQIIRDEMNNLGGQEVVLSSLQDRELWQLSERWDSADVDVWFKTQLQGGGELGLAWSHEEPMTRIISQHISSYKDLPVYTYQVQNKLRNELRAKSGLMRAREFVMKDLYSFSKNQQEHDDFYAKITDAYMRVYEKLGIGQITYKTFASGGAFSKYSDEFQTISSIGEDKIYINEQKRIAVNQEVYNDEVLADLGLDKSEMVEKNAIEVGNIFTLGTRFSEPLGAYYSDEQGIQQPIFMGCYGIGPSRIMGLLAEHFADDKGLVWPKSVAPFNVYLARLSTGVEVVKAADELYNQLTASGSSVIYDDRDARAGEMFADAELMGIPYRVVVSERTAQSGLHELKTRAGGKEQTLNTQDIVSKLANNKTT